MSTPVKFEKTSTMPLRFSKKLGRCVGWGCFSKKAGEEYDDEHGDHFPDDELFKAVGGLMKMDFADREIDIEHMLAKQGSIVSAFAMTEDVAKSLNCDTGGNYGVLLDFEPNAELLKSIEDGDMFSLSMYGTAVAEPIAKSAGEVEVSAAKRKRVMRDVKLTKWAVCKSPAHVGAGVTLVKSLPSDEMLEAVLKTRPVSASVTVVKRAPAATSIELGHQHSIYDADEKDGSTSYERAEGFQYGHSHQWLRGADGAITFLVADGHTHTLATETIAMSKPEDFAKSQADLATSRQREVTLMKMLLIAASLAPTEAAYAKRLGPAELETFLSKSEEERKTAATPIFVSKSTGDAYFASDDSRLITMAKGRDADAEKFAKSEKLSKALAFAKRADEEIPGLPGTADERGAMLAAVEGIEDETVRKSALESLKAASAAMVPLTKKVGHSVVKNDGGAVDAEKALHDAHAEFAKKLGKTPQECASEFAATEEGQKLFDAAYNK